jgi:uncharacterized membrane protein
MKKILLLASSTLILFACTKNSGENTGGNSCGTPGPKFTAVKAVLSTTCAVTGCHAGPNPQNGLNYNDDCTIQAQAARIRLRAVDQAGTANQMPPPPMAPLSTADRQKITDWVAAGGRVTD